MQFFLSKRKNIGIKLGLTLSIIGTISLKYAIISSEQTFGYIGTSLFALGNGISISIAVTMLSKLSSSYLSYPSLSMGYIMIFTVLIAAVYSILKINGVVFVGIIYLLYLIVWLGLQQKK